MQLYILNDEMRTFFTLDRKGAVLALLMGALVFGFGGSAGPFFLLALLLFLVISYIATEMGKEIKKRIRTYEKGRGWRNVVANGIVPVVLAAFYYINRLHRLMPGSVIVVAYVGSIAAVAADTFSSEIGVLGGMPIMLLTLKRVKRGVSGGVSVLGTVAGVFAAAVIGSVVFFYVDSVLLVAVIMIAGSVGDIADSFLGYFEVKGIGNKYTSNIACSIVGAFVGAVMFFMLRIYI